MISGRKICEPSAPSWPKLTDTANQESREIIERIFKKYKKCLRAQSKDGRTGVILDELNDQEKEERKIFRSTFVIGFNAVIKKLETDQLRLVLMNKSTYPAVLKTAVLSMTTQQGCTAITLSDLLTPISESWTSIKSATCIGIMKTDGKNDFDELVDYINDLKLQLPKRNLPYIDRQKVFHEIKQSMTVGNGKSASKPTEKIALIKHTRPVRPVVDFTKYYKEFDKNEQQKKFAGQSFISFTDDVCDEVMVFKNGTKVTEELSKDIECYGIKPFLSEISSEELSKGVKRKQDSTYSKSDFKSITIQQLQPNTNKNKKKKIKKMKK